MAKKYACFCKEGKGKHSSKKAVIDCKRSNFPDYGKTVKIQSLVPQESSSEKNQILIQKQQIEILTTRAKTYQIKPLTPAQYSQMRHFMTDTLSLNEQVNILYSARRKLDKAIQQEADRFTIKQLEYEFTQQISTVRRYLQLYLIGQETSHLTKKQEIHQALKKLLTQNNFRPNFFKLDRMMSLYDKYVQQKHHILGRVDSFQGQYTQLQPIISPLKSRTINAKMNIISKIGLIVMSRQISDSYEHFKPIFIDYAIQKYLQQVNQQQFADQQDRRGRIQVAILMIKQQANTILVSVFNRLSSCVSLKTILALPLLVFPNLTLQLISLAEIFRQAKTKKVQKNIQEVLNQSRQVIKKPKWPIQKIQLRPITQQQRAAIRIWQKQTHKRCIPDHEHQLQENNLQGQLHGINRFMHMESQKAFQKTLVPSFNFSSYQSKREQRLIQMGRPTPVYSRFRMVSSSKIPIQFVKQVQNVQNAKQKKIKKRLQK